MNVLKQLELIHKKIWIAILRLIINSPARTTVDLNTVQHILVLRYDRIGDMVISTPLFRLIKEQYPHITLDVVASPINYSIIKYDTTISDIFIYHKNVFKIIGLLFALHKKKYSLVINLVFYPSLTGALLANFGTPRSSVRMRVAVETERDFFYHINIKKRIWGAACRTMVEETAAFLPVLGITLQNQDLRPGITIPDSLKKRARDFIAPFKEKIKIGINISAGAAFREWGSENHREFIACCNRKISTSVLFIFAMQGSSQLKELQERDLPANVVFIPFTTDILYSISYLEVMDMLVSPDTSFIHIASALKLPTVGLFLNDEKVTLWPPFKIPNRILNAHDTTIKNIPVDAVCASTLDLLNECSRIVVENKEGS